MSLADRQLSEHFWLSELTRSDLAARQGIDNSPSAEAIANLERTAAGTEQCRALLANRAGHEVPIVTLSGFRCEALERLLCARDFAAWCALHGKLAPGAALAAIEASWREYFARKRHPRGLADDWIAPRYGTPYQICLLISKSAIGYDQLIYEHGWVHTSWPEERKLPRRDVLTLMPDGSYMPGVIER